MLILAEGGRIPVDNPAGHFELAIDESKSLEYSGRRTHWDGGVRRLLPEMTYTATGFSNPVRVIFDAVFRPTTVEDTSETVSEHFRTAILREKARVHLVDKIVFHPIRDGSNVVCARPCLIAPRTAKRLRRLCIADAAGCNGAVFIILAL